MRVSRYHEVGEAVLAVLNRLLSRKCSMFEVTTLGQPLEVGTTHMDVNNAYTHVTAMRRS